MKWDLSLEQIQADDQDCTGETDQNPDPEHAPIADYPAGQPFIQWFDEDQSVSLALDPHFAGLDFGTK